MCVKLKTKLIYEPNNLYICAMPALLRKIYRFYLEGFKNMTVGKTLWVIIVIKLAVMFLILKVFFFRDALADYKTPEEKSKHVIEQLTK